MKVSQGRSGLFENFENGWPPYNTCFKNRWPKYFSNFPRTLYKFNRSIKNGQFVIKQAAALPNCNPLVFFCVGRDWEWCDQQILQHEAVFLQQDHGGLAQHPQGVKWRRPSGGSCSASRRSSQLVSIFLKKYNPDIYMYVWWKFH